jgi:ornithine carbamoyltransferase
MRRDFLRLADLTVAEHDTLFKRAAELKADRRARRTHATLAGRTLALIFEKASTRTRLSFEAAMLELGGHVITLDAQGSQIGRGEPITDTARVVSRYADAIMFRTSTDERLHELARAATVPVINGLSEGGHPVQLLADLMTVRERLGELRGKVIAFVGDGACNMSRSWIEAAALFDFELRVAAPEGYRPPVPGRAKIVGDPGEAVAGADVIATDVWTSMGQEAESAIRLKALGAYTVDAALVARAKKDAIVLHCLPAHRGEEITAEVLEGPQSAVWDEAENRMHAQKALLELLLLDR